MCGFSGYFNIKGCNENLLLKMVNILKHRGPNDEGIWLNSNNTLGFAHTRLSILDLSKAGHQPMHSQSNRYIIAFNGEIYNHLELRKDLLENINWQGHSDTETLLNCFDHWGIQKTLKRIIGMFAFAVFDKKKSVIILARDRIGEKPLYYGWQKNTFLFGSEIKALKIHPEFNKEINHIALLKYIRYGYIPSPYSIYNNIYKLTPGSYIEFNCKNSSLSKPISYWSLIESADLQKNQSFLGSDEEALKELEKYIYQSIKRQKISDVPLGAFLSGGIDSTTIASLLQSQSNKPVHTFTIGFKEEEYDESKDAKIIAKHLGTNHNELIVSSEDALSVIPNLASIYDEPFADASQIPTFLISQFAKKSVTVSLSGDGGDELFGGYNRYVWGSKIDKFPEIFKNISSKGLNLLSPDHWDRLYKIVKPLIPKKFELRMPGEKAQKLSYLLKSNSTEEMYQNLISTWHQPEKILLKNINIDLSENYWEFTKNIYPIEKKMMTLDLLQYLPDDILCKIDRAAMNVSLETRVPFLDQNLVEFAINLPINMKIRRGQSKWLLRKLLNKYVPEKLINRPKMGFGVPIDHWLRGPLKDWAEDLLSEKRIENDGFFNSHLIREKWEQHQSGKKNWQYHLWVVLMFQCWYSENN